MEKTTSIPKRQDYWSRNWTLRLRLSRLLWKSEINEIMSNAKNFREFLDSDNNAEKYLPTERSVESIDTTNIINALKMASPLAQLNVIGLAQLKDGFKDKLAKSFLEKVKTLSRSQEVISELTNDIGVPLENETEDEFVARAKGAMAKILRRKLS